MDLHQVWRASRTRVTAQLKAAAVDALQVAIFASLCALVAVCWLRVFLLFWSGTEIGLAVALVVLAIVASPLDHQTGPRDGKHP
jgi:hypothetical protein